LPKIKQFSPQKFWAGYATVCKALYPYCGLMSDPTVLHCTKALQDEHILRCFYKMAAWFDAKKE